MQKMRKISIDEAREIARSGKREASVLQRFEKYWTALAEGEAGKLKVKDSREGFRVRANLKRSAKSLEIRGEIRKRGNEVLFWKEPTIPSKSARAKVRTS